MNAFLVPSEEGFIVLVCGPSSIKQMMKNFYCVYLLFRLLLGVILHRSIETSACLTEDEVNARKDVKKQIFGGLTFLRAGDIAAGTAVPIFSYELSDVLLVHWSIKDVPGMQSFLNLPDGLKLAPIQLYVGPEPGDYYLTLIARKVESGSVVDPGFYQVDWVVYVTSPTDTEPVLLTIETVGTQDIYAATGLKLASTIGVSVGASTYALKVSEPTLKFTVNIRMNELSIKRTLSPVFIRTFDKLYWKNGVFSKLYFTGSLFEADVLEHNSFRSKVVESTPWSRYLKRNPVSVATFQDGLSLGEQVWVNSASVTDPAQQAYLSAVITQVLAGKTYNEGVNVMAGLQEATVGLTVSATDVPAAFINFHVPDHKLADLASAIQLPTGFTLSPLQTLMNGPKQHIISLNIYSASGIAPGFRAEWSTYVNAPGSDTPSFFVIDVATSTASLDPVRLYTSPAQLFTLQLDPTSGILTTAIQSGTNSFSAALPANLDCPMLPNRRKKGLPPKGDGSFCAAISDEFLAANDLIYWSNGVADKGYYDGKQYRDVVKVLNVENVTINDGTMWRSFWDHVSEVFLYRNEQDFILNPWYNLEEVAVCA